jgi:ribonuclease HI
MHDYIIVADGGSLGNGTENSIGYGSFIVEVPCRNFISRRFTRRFGLGITNNEAEYMIIVAVLEFILEGMKTNAVDPTDKSVCIKTDSQLVVGQLTQGWKVNAENLRPLFSKVVNLMKKFSLVLFVKVDGREVKRILGH